MAVRADALGAIGLAYVDLLAPDEHDKKDCTHPAPSWPASGFGSSTPNKPAKWMT